MVRGFPIFIVAALASRVDSTIPPPLAWLQNPVIAPSEHHPSHLLLTAVTHEPDPPHHARLQCLNLTGEAFAPYPTVGESVYVSSVSNVTYVILPPGAAEGWHRPPHPMFFVLLSGFARVETPSTGDSVDVSGKNTLLLALDVQGKGHLTFYPGVTETLALQIPLTEEALEDLKLEVVHEGPCK